jgi:hypothetical protein
MNPTPVTHHDIKRSLTKATKEIHAVALLKQGNHLWAQMNNVKSFIKSANEYASLKQKVLDFLDEDAARPASERAVSAERRAEVEAAIARVEQANMF